MSFDSASFAGFHPSLCLSVTHGSPGIIEGGCLSSITSLSILDQTKIDMKVIRLVAVFRNICHYKLDLVSFAQRSTQSSSGHLEASGGRPELQHLMGRVIKMNKMMSEISKLLT